MNRKTALDIAIFISCITGFILSRTYLENPMTRQASMAVLLVVGILFFILAMVDAKRTVYADRHGTSRKEISEILLLSEEGHVTGWKKTTLFILVLHQLKYAKRKEDKHEQFDQMSEWTFIFRKEIRNHMPVLQY